jgi:hydrogenase maturation protease
MKRILVAGVGNIFLGDDGFGGAVVERLAKSPRRDNVDVVDFGIRGVDLTFALMKGYDAAILVDIAQRGGAPGTLYVIEPKISPSSDPQATLSDAHSAHPARVLSFVSALGGGVDHVVVVACEPTAVAPDEPEVVVGLSDAVGAAIDPAVAIIESLLIDLRKEPVEVLRDA